MTDTYYTEDEAIEVEFEVEDFPGYDGRNERDIKILELKIRDVQIPPATMKALPPALFDKLEEDINSYLDAA